jgi:putative Mn2+ efflux pump MntP
MIRLERFATHGGVILIVFGIGLIVFQMARRPHKCAICETSHRGGKFNPAVSTTYSGLLLIGIGLCW